MKLFDENITLLGKSLDFRATRNKFISSNLANLETPNFKAQDIHFEEQLKYALQAEEPIPLITNHQKHIKSDRITPLEKVEGEVLRTYNPDPKKDGNSVDFDKELAKLAENRIMYEASSKMMTHKLNLLKISITEGAR